MSAEFTESERIIITRTVREDKLADLLPVLYERGLHLDDTAVEPLEGSGTPDVIISICKATKSILIFGDSRLTYVEGKRGVKADEHWPLFDRMTEKYQPWPTN